MFQQDTAELITTGPVVQTPNKPVPNDLIIRPSGTYIFYYDVKCTKAGTGNISFNSRGQS